jgi:hypothetical protein
MLSRCTATRTLSKAASDIARTWRTEIAALVLGASHLDATPIRGMYFALDRSVRGTSISVIVERGARRRRAGPRTSLAHLTLRSLVAARRRACRRAARTQSRMRAGAGTPQQPLVGLGRAEQRTQRRVRLRRYSNTATTATINATAQQTARVTTRSCSVALALILRLARRTAESVGAPPLG